MLKQSDYEKIHKDLIQPPSGGCVLKQGGGKESGSGQGPAAFRRLCVETLESVKVSVADLPAAFRRLCVETNVGH